MLFKDRLEAGAELAARLSPYRGQNPLILAVPRGGVGVAVPIHEALGGELDLFITRKIGAPYQEELAIGATGGEGHLLLNEMLVARLNVAKSYIEKAAAKERAEIKRRLALYRGQRPAPVLKDRLVILVDDGVATGYTLLAALNFLAAQKIKRLVLAVPVGPPDTLKELARGADEIVYLAAPASFRAVGQFYQDFRQVNDDEVVRLLQEAWQED